MSCCIDGSLPANRICYPHFPIIFVLLLYCRFDAGESLLQETFKVWKLFASFKKNDFNKWFIFCISNNSFWECDVAFIIQRFQKTLCMMTFLINLQYLAQKWWVIYYIGHKTFSICKSLWFLAYSNKSPLLLSLYIVKVAIEF